MQVQSSRAALTAASKGASASCVLWVTMWAAGTQQTRHGEATLREGYRAARSQDPEYVAILLNVGRFQDTLVGRPA